MSILDDIRTIGLKMKNEQASLKEIILSRVGLMFRMNKSMA